MNLLRTLPAALAAAALLAPVSAYAGDADFTMINQTGFTIKEVYISPPRKNKWGKDRLGEGVLRNDKQKHFKFKDNASCKQDIKVVFEENKQSVTWDDIDLCKVNKLTLKYNAQTKKTTAVKS
jgi:hypothetical protein